MADKKLIIADGHHRYETALNYSKEHAPPRLPRTEHERQRHLPQPAYPEAAVMMTFVNMDSDGLVILPTHRVVHSLAGLIPAAFTRAAEHSSRSKSCRTADAASYMNALEAASGNGVCRRHARRRVPAEIEAGSCLSALSPASAGAPAPARPEPPAHHHARASARPRSPKRFASRPTSAIFAMPTKQSTRCDVAKPTSRSSPILSRWNNCAKSPSPAR